MSECRCLLSYAYNSGDSACKLAVTRPKRPRKSLSCLITSKSEIRSCCITHYSRSPPYTLDVKQPQHSTARSRHTDLSITPHLATMNPSRARVYMKTVRPTYLPIFALLRYNISNQSTKPRRTLQPYQQRRRSKASKAPDADAH
jgi:hypothetical protein